MDRVPNPHAGGPGPIPGTGITSLTRKVDVCSAPENCGSRGSKPTLNCRSSNREMTTLVSIGGLEHQT